MADTYKAVEVSAPGVLRVVERSVSEPGRVRSRSEWKPAESVTRDAATVMGTIRV